MKPKPSTKAKTHFTQRILNFKKAPPAKDIVSKVKVNFEKPNQAKSIRSPSPMTSPAQLSAAGAMQLAQSPTQKQPKYNKELQTYQQKANAQRFTAQKKYTTYTEEENERVQDQPFSLACVEASLGRERDQEQQRPGPGSNTLNRFEKAVKPFREDSDSLRPATQLAMHGPPQGQAAQAQMPSALRGQPCLMCKKHALNGQLCMSCEMNKFDKLVQGTTFQIQTLNDEPKTVPGGNSKSGRASTARGMDTDFGYGQSQLRSSRCTSPQKQEQVSPEMVFEVARDDKSENSSAGGGEPIETAMRSAGELGAQVVPTQEGQRNFIFEQHTETEQSPTPESIKANRLDLLDHRPILSMDSLPRDLQDSQESISATKNLSRYQDESVTMQALEGQLKHNITYENPQGRPSNPKVQIQRLNLTNKNDEVKGPTQTESQAINPGQRNNLFDTGNNRVGRGDITPYSFADGLNLRDREQDVSSPTERMTEPMRDERKQPRAPSQDEQDPYMTGKINIQSMAIKGNPFDITQLKIGAHDNALERKTAIFGNQLPARGSQNLNQGHRSEPNRYYAQSQDNEQSSPNRIMTTEIPESDFLRPPDSARNNLLSSQNEEENLNIIFRSNQQSSRASQQRAPTVNRRTISSHNQQSHNTLNQNELDQARRLSQDSDKVRFEQNLHSQSQSTLQRKVTYRLNNRQIQALTAKHKRWRDQLTIKQKIMQQQIKHVLILPTFNLAQIFFSILTLTFSFLGFLFYFSADKNHHQVIEYGDMCESQGRDCTIYFSPTVDLMSPLLYYELDQFYSNNRMVATTYSLWRQLRGESIDQSECQGISTVADLLPDLSVYARFADVDALSTLEPDTPLNPCGVLAKYVFTDSFSLARQSDLSEMVIEESDISHERDRELRFKRAEDSENFQWLDVTNEHFIVWHQMSTQSKVKHLWGRTSEDLKTNETYILRIDNSYDRAIFGGEKRLYLQEVNELGGSNKFLGIFFIGAAVLLIMIQVAFLCLYVLRISNKPGGVKEFYNPDNYRDW